MWFSMKKKLHIFPKEILDAIKTRNIKTLNTLIKNHPKKLDTETLAILLIEAGWEIYHTILLEDLKITEFMIIHGSGINICDKKDNHESALHKAVYNCDIKSVKFLLKCGANPNVYDWLGFTPLIAAIDPDIPAPTAFKWLLIRSPQHHTTRIECVKLLLDKGADVNIRSFEGYTPLTATMLFQLPGCESIIQLLLDHGAILNDETLITILKKARKPENREIIQPILARIALTHALNMSVTAKMSKLINLNTNTASYFDKCIREIQCMKATNIIGNCKATYFSILNDKELQLINYLRNKKLSNHFYRTDFEYKFPIYARIIIKRFRKAADQLILIENAVNVLVKNIEQLNGNLYVIEMIVKYLENHDLQLLIQYNTG